MWESISSTNVNLSRSTKTFVGSPSPINNYFHKVDLEITYITLNSSCFHDQLMPQSAQVKIRQLYLAWKYIRVHDFILLLDSCKHSATTTFVMNCKAKFKCHAAKTKTSTQRTLQLCVALCVHICRPLHAQACPINSCLQLNACAY